MQIHPLEARGRRWLYHQDVGILPTPALCLSPNERFYLNSFSRDANGKGADIGIETTFGDLIGQRCCVG